MVDEVLLSADRPLRDVIALGPGTAVLVQSALAQMRGWTIMYLTTHLNLQWVSDVFGKLVRLPLDWFEKRQLGDVLSRFGSVGPIQDLLTTRAVGAVLDGMMALATLAMMLLYSPMLTAVVVGHRAAVRAGAGAVVPAAARRQPGRHGAGGQGADLPAGDDPRDRADQAVRPRADRRARWMALKVDTINRTVRTQLMGLWFGNINSASAPCPPRWCCGWAPAW